MSRRYWADDPYWREAAEAFVNARSRGVRRVSIDLDALEEVMYRGDGPAYRLLEAMLSIQEREAFDGFRGAPRVLAGLVMRLSQLTREDSATDALTAVLSDITQLRVDAMVNAANESLAPGGGVCGAIHAAAGPELALACAKVAPCKEGQARITAAFALPSTYVIHTVGPRWHGGDRGEPATLTSAYRSTFGIARAYGVGRIAFPSISSGIFGYPLRPATAIAVQEAHAAIDRGDVQRVIFACFSREVLAAYAAEGVTVAQRE